jgi:phage terminase small subunit
VALTDKRQVFIEEYLATWNATEAARRAGYAFPNVEGSKLLVIPSIREEIDKRIAEKTMSANEVLVRLSEHARNEHGAYITANGDVDLDGLIRDGKRHLIKGVKETKYGRNIEFYDAQSALVHIGKHHGLFSDKVEHSGTVVNAMTTLDEWKKHQAAAKQQAKDALDALGDDESQD